jgi:hypothetical protein
LHPYWQHKPTLTHALWWQPYQLISIYRTEYKGYLDWDNMQLLSLLYSYFPHYYTNVFWSPMYIWFHQLHSYYDYFLYFLMRFFGYCYCYEILPWMCWKLIDLLRISILGWLDWRYWRCSHLEVCDELFQVLCNHIAKLGNQPCYQLLLARITLQQIPLTWFLCYGWSVFQHIW